MHLFQFGPTRDIRAENRVAQEQRQAAVRQKQIVQLGSHDVEQIQRGSGPLEMNEGTGANTASAAVSTAPLSATDQIRAARVAAHANPQQSEQLQQGAETPIINHTVAQVPPSKPPSEGFLSTLSSATTTLAQIVGLASRPLTEIEKVQEQQKMLDTRVKRFLQPSTQGSHSSSSSSTSNSSSSRGKAAATTSASSAAAVTIEDDDTLAARRFDQLDTRQRQPSIIETSIDAYNTRRDERVTNAVARGENINNEEALAHNDRLEQFEPLGQQLAKKAIEFTESAMNLAEQGSSLNQPALHYVARRYDDLAAIADAGVADFKTRLKKETISDRDLNEVTESYQELMARAKRLEGDKTYAEKGIQFSNAAYANTSSSASELDSAAAAVPYDRLADYCFKMVKNRGQITAEERKHYEPMVTWASQALEARDFGSNELANALDKNIQTHEAFARCAERRDQCSEAQGRLILSHALAAYSEASISRNKVIEAKSSEMERSKKLTAATSDEEANRALLVAEQNEVYQKSGAEDQQASRSSSSRSASTIELATNADGYEQVARSLERAASSQEAIAALPDIPSKIKSQKQLKERAQGFLAEAQKLHATAFEQLQRNKASEAEDTLNKAGLQLANVDRAVEAARTAAAKVAGSLA